MIDTKADSVPILSYSETEEPSLSYSIRVTRLRNACADALIDAVGKWASTLNPENGPKAACEGDVLVAFEDLQTLNALIESARDNECAAGALCDGTTAASTREAWVR